MIINLCSIILIFILVLGLVQVPTLGNQKENIPECKRCCHQVSWCLSYWDYLEIHKQHMEIYEYIQGWLDRKGSKLGSEEAEATLIHLYKCLKCIGGYSSKLKLNKYALNFSIETFFWKFLAKNIETTQFLNKKLCKNSI